MSIILSSDLLVVVVYRLSREGLNLQGRFRQLEQLYRAEKKENEFLRNQMDTTSAGENDTDRANLLDRQLGGKDAQIKSLTVERDQLDQDLREMT